MARNQEKAQSMLYRFREAQASSLGLSSKSARRPRLASSVTSLKECEKWRGEVLREISRKVSKIQDFGLSDYEVRDLNDEINKLLREKTHWENQILALGGANYKRAVPSVLGGDAGAGAGRYKYFGRAKDLPGVKELFSSDKTKGEEGGWRSDRYQRFRNLPPSYYGDEDEDDGVLLEEEGRGEEGEWNERYLQVITGLRRDVRRREVHDEQADEDMDVSDADEDVSASGGIVIPTIPRPVPTPWKQNMAAFQQSLSTSYTQHPTEATESAEVAESSASAGEKTKRPSQDTEDDAEPGSAKRQKRADGQAVPTAPNTVAPTEETHAPAAVGFSIFSAADLAHPTIPDRSAIERMILLAKKRQLRQEYIGSA